MPANSWPENDSYSEFDPLNSLLSELSVDDEEPMEEAYNNSLSLPSRFQNRRRKAALVFTVVWSGTIALHLASWGLLFVLGFTLIIGIHAFKTVFSKPRIYPEVIKGNLPFITLLVAAKNEEAVIGNLAKNLCNLKYPNDNYEVWIVDDDSTDKTPQILAEAAKEYKHLNVFQRKPGATGGKSGALNQVLSLTKGEIVAVFDADAQIPPDLLMDVVPLFQRSKVGAVQVRKAIANADENLWTKGQAVEMPLDMFLLHQRTASGGIGELRGNGQFVRREALKSCGGWNEETITDDLDLTLRLHLDNWDIECVFDSYVKEEGVTNAVALWHQRNRWAEGGYQRYLDYWDLILKNRMGTRKTCDMLIFMLIMYILPAAVVPDFFMAAIRHRLPIYSPLTTLTMSVSMIGMFRGLVRARKGEKLTISAYLVLMLQTVRGILYMSHWFIVIASANARMAVLPKRLKWVKTFHQGNMS